MEDNQYIVVPLHEQPHLILQCCRLLNDEWKRSDTARLRSIENSNVNLPLSLLLVIVTGKAELVIGHAKMSRLPSDPKGCWIESVVISPAYRQKGLGKLIMMECENLASKMGFSTSYLSTHDQQIFYSKLGYTLCEPVCQFGSVAPFVHHPKKDTPVKECALNGCDVSSRFHGMNNGSGTSAPGPPPMPKSIVNVKSPVPVRIYMKKVLTS